MTIIAIVICCVVVLMMIILAVGNVVGEKEFWSSQPHRDFDREEGDA